MQERNDLEELLKSKVGALDDLLKEPMHPKAVTRTISMLPNQGEIIQLRGIDFVVRYVNKRTGKLHLEIRAVEHRDEAAGEGADESPKDLRTEE